jgi:hypothetical protein
MALKGTLKDFGIADILQLIGQQQKTGYLKLANKGEQVQVSFRDGNIVKAEAVQRNKRELIGSMLVAAELLTEAQLELALEAQRRTLQRLGDVLVEQRVLSAEKFRQMVQLQTSETLFQLFAWKTGTYEFEQADVEQDPTLTSLRAESVLMEGFRQVDEWPVVRKRITSLQMTFQRLKPLPPPVLARDDFDDALDDAFSEEKKDVDAGEFQSVGESERKVYALAEPGRTAARIIELSCLGEFETAKALCNLVNLEFLAGLPPRKKGGRDFRDSRSSVLAGVLGRVAVTAVVVGGLVFVGSQLDLVGIKAPQGRNDTRYTDPAAQRFASRAQLSRISAALDLFRLERGAFPGALSELVESGLLAADDLRFPWRDPYYYRRTDEGAYVLLPPLR